MSTSLITTVQSTMATTSAVTVQNASTSYGKNEVLKNICMRVSRGCIYGLLGSSGCGKTTLLNCLVGQKQLNSGDIWVLGGKPGTPGSGVPGAKVGYMPQDIALVGEFTVQDAIYYFGRIFDMSERKIQERFDELSNLLDLPPKSRFIRDCSGGQQRRVSFAASMVHTPELLILDEPTVGVDPILRERIWDYLVEITSQTRMAVIITTHYIEEARQANVIGLMREGRLLVEDSPTNLLNTYQTELLEHVFLVLSQRQNEGKLNDSQSTSNTQVQNSNTDISVFSIDENSGSTAELLAKKTKPVGGYSLNCKRLKALLDKNWKQFYRNVSGVIFVLLLPVILIVLFLSVVGPDAKDLELAIINKESMTLLCQNFTTENTAVPYGFTDCHFANISCRFLTYLEHPMIKKIQYDDLPEALDDIRHGKIVGVLYMAENLTDSFENRMTRGRFVDKGVLSASEIQVWLDMSNRPVGGGLKYKLLTLFNDFQKDLLKDCNYDAKMADFIRLKTIYGQHDDAFSEFIIPGYLLTVIFYMMTLMTSQIIVTDRREGLWNRSIIAGVSSIEISLSHLIIQTCIVVTYTIDILVITFALFQVETVGSIWTLTLITFLQGLAGMGCGFCISIISYNAAMANIIATGSFYLIVLISGTVWPLEGMPIGLQWISKCLPFTIATQSFRNVMKKGWTWQNWQVLNGIGIEVFWIILLLVGNTVLIKTKR